MPTDWKQVKKNLLRKPTWRELVDLFIFSMVIFMYWAYGHDVDALNEVIIRQQEYIEDECIDLKPNLNDSIGFNYFPADLELKDNGEGEG